MIIEMTGAEWFTTRPGGLNRYFESLYLALRDHPGVDVHATAFGDPPEGGYSWGPAAKGLAARHLTSRRRPGLTPTVIDRHFVPYGPGVPLRRTTQFVLHFQGPWHAESRAAGHPELAVKAKHAFEALRYARADHAVVLCEEFGQILHERYRFPASRISVIPPGVDLTRFQSAPAPTTDQPLVLCVRRLERRMGIDVLIAAWESVVRASPGARLVVVGDGTERAALQQQIEQLGLAGSITLAGRVDDEALGRYYREASLTVVPTRSLEGFGLIALESLASGRAPIVTRCGGLPDAVNGLDPSLVVPIEDSEALADRISRGLAGELPDAAACRRHAQTFDWKDVAARHVDLYQRLGR